MQSFLSSIAEVWHYRELARNLVSRDLKLRYQSSVLGFFWSLLHPLAFMGVYSFAFTVVLPIKAIEQFPLFFISGYLPWICIHQSLTASTPSLVDNGGLLKKIYFPREVLPLSQCLGFGVNLLLMLAVLVPVLWVFDHPPGLAHLALAPLLLVQLVGTVGGALLLSIAYVRLRDLTYLLDLGLTMLFWLTPVVYAPELVPERFRWIIALNPFTGLLGAYRSILLDRALPDPAVWLTLTGLATGVAVLGIVAFQRGSHRLTEFL